MIIRTVAQAIDGRALVSVAPGSTILELCRLLAAQNIGAVPVLDQGVLAGVISERDVVRRVVINELPASDTLVGDIMTREPTTVWSGTSLVLAMDLMLRGGFRHLPVTDDEHCVGMLSIRDIPNQYRVLYDRYEAALGELDEVSKAPA